MSLDEKKKKTERKNHAFESEPKNTNEIESHNGMTYIYNLFYKKA